MHWIPNEMYALTFSTLISPNFFISFSIVPLCASRTRQRVNAKWNIQFISRFWYLSHWFDYVLFVCLCVSWMCECMQQICRHKQISSTKLKKNYLLPYRAIEIFSVCSSFFIFFFSISAFSFRCLAFYQKARSGSHISPAKK